MISCVWCYKNIKMYLFHKKKGDPQSNTKGDRVTQADAWDDVNDDVVVNCICKSKKVKKSYISETGSERMPNVVLNRDSGDTWCRLLSSANIQNLLSSANIQNLFSSAKLALLTYRSFSASLTYRSFSTVPTHRLRLSSADLQMYRTQGYPFWRGCRVYLLWPVF